MVLASPCWTNAGRPPGEDHDSFENVLTGLLTLKAGAIDHCCPEFRLWETAASELLINRPSGNGTKPATEQFFKSKLRMLSSVASMILAHEHFSWHDAARRRQPAFSHRRPLRHRKRSPRPKNGRKHCQNRRRLRRPLRLQSLLRQSQSLLRQSLPRPRPKRRPPHPRQNQIRPKSAHPHRHP